MGKIHARVLAKLELLGGVVEPFEVNAAQAKQNLSVPVYKELDEAINAMPSISAVVIAVPTRFHAGLYEEVIAKIPGLKAILLEKPMAETAADCTILMEKYPEWKDKTIVGHIEVYNPVVTKFLQLMQTEEFGSIRTISIYRKGAVPEARLSSLSGVLEDIGVHDFDILSRLITGKVKLSCTGLYRQDSLNSAIVSIQNGHSQGFIHLSREFAGKERQIIVECENATIFCDLIGQSIEIRSLQSLIGGDAIITIPHGPGTTLKIYGEPLQEEIVNLRDIVKGLAKPKVSMENGYRAMQFVEACKQALISNDFVEINIQ